MQKQERIGLSGSSCKVSLNEKGLKVCRGVVQDASFITFDPGRARADKSRGEEAKTRRSRDGTWVKKGGESVFGY